MPTAYTIPGQLTAPELGKVNVRGTPQGWAVEVTILMEPEGAESEGWQTGVALDASASMKSAFGGSLSGKPPPEALAEYRKLGWLYAREEDGRSVTTLTADAYRDAMAKGHVRMSENLMQPLARQFLAYLAGNLDADGGTTVIYWACGRGEAIEVLGDVTEAQCAALTVAGPRSAGFGTSTVLRPAVQYFVDRFADAKRGMYLFLTDGRLDDLDAVKAYTTDLAREIAAGTRHPVKCVLIGVGASVDEGQMEQLDDLDTCTSVDIWDHKIAADLRDVQEIFAEVVTDSQIVASTGAIYDAAGRKVKAYTDGLPAKIEFVVPAGSDHFELEVAGRRIRQRLAEGA